MMRPEAEIRRALRHFEEASAHVPRMKDGAVSPQFVENTAKLIDMLRWVLDEPSRFEAALAMLDQVDHFDKHSRS